MAVIDVVDVWKSFRIYEQRTRTLKEVLLVRRSAYETFWALRGVSFEVNPGDMLGLIGPNGSGKSTMLKTIANIYRPNQGTVSVAGKISAMLELGTGFHPELSGHDNIYLAGSIMGLSSRDVDTRYDKIVEFAGIGEFIETAVKNYSSGMYARLAFALAINVDAEVVLIDEVLAVGDEAFQMKCQDKIHEMRKDGTTIVFVTHSLDVVRNLCTRCVWLDKGEIRKHGDASEVVATYFEEVHGAEDQRGAWVSPAAGDRIGTGEVQVTGLAVCGPDGIEHNDFRPGAPLTIRISYEATSPQSDVAVSIEIRRPDGRLLTSVGSTASRPPFAIAKGGGEIDYVVPALPLVPGTYELTIGLHDPNRKRIYDWLERTHSISVAGPSNNDAALYLLGQWHITPGPASGLASRLSRPTH